MPREVSAGAVLFRGPKKDPQFLLLHYPGGHWDFPKGNIEEGENEQETVRREILEETGIRRMRFVDGFRHTVRYFYRWKGQGIFKIVVYYLVHTPQKQVRLSFEHTGYEWLPCEAALARLSFSNSKHLLKKAMDFLISGRN